MDQFLISNMMIVLDPDRPEEKKGHHKVFYSELFDQLDRLSKLQLIVCPASPIHDNESVVDSRYERLRAIVGQLSHGLEFMDSEWIGNAEIIRAFSVWLGKEDVGDPLSRRDVLTGNPNEWQDRFRVSLNYTVPGLAAELKGNSAVANARLAEVAERWKSDTEFDFETVFREEAMGIGKSILEQFERFTVEFIRAGAGGNPISPMLLAPPRALTLIQTMIRDLKETAPDPPRQFEVIREFFRSNEFLDLFYVKVTALFWATLAKEIHSGRGPSKYPKSGFYNDVDAVACYGPYCEAMFVDKEISHLSRQGRFGEELSERVHLYSLREKDEFLSALRGIEEAASSEHLSTAADVYGEEFFTPYRSILTDKT